MADEANFGSSEAASMGGKARAELLSQDERTESARKAAEARWAKAGRLVNPVRTATHGDPDHPLKIGSLELPCYVLEDGTRVLSGRGMQTALNLGQGHGALLDRFLSRKSFKSFIGEQLAMGLKNPIRFIRPGRGGKLATGYEATILVDICDMVLAARKAGKLLASEELVADQCEILTRALAKVGIIALIDEATGYQQDRARDALSKILEAFIAKELRQWVKTFPVDYYKELYRLRKREFPPKNNRMPRYFGVITNDIVYSRSAPGVLEELKERNPAGDRGYRKNRNHQWLTEDIGHPKLLQHLAAVVALMRASMDYEGFRKLLDKALPKQISMPLFEQQAIVPAVE